MKATLRQSGVRKITLSVKFHVDRDTVIRVFSEWIDQDEKPPTSRAEAERIIRLKLFAWGWTATLNDEEEDVGPGPSKVIVRQATELCDRLFPDLKG